MAWITKRKIGKPNHTENVIKDKPDKWSKYYGNSKYRKLRDWYMANHPLCEDCAVNGISRPSEHLHHIRPISTGATMEERFELLLDWEHNFAALCHECHAKRHAILNHSE